MVIPPFVGCWKLELRGHSILVQFHSGCDAAYPHVGAVVVVSPKPFVAHSLVLSDKLDGFAVDPYFW